MPAGVCEPLLLTFGATFANLLVPLWQLAYNRLEPSCALP